MKTYTFHVSVLDLRDSWRKVELTGEQTLLDLHVAIQEALDWEPDDDITFVLGDDPLGDGEQFVIFDQEGTDDEDDWEEDELTDEEIEAAVDAMPPLDLGDQPKPETFEQMLSLLESNPDVRAQVGKMLTEQLGIPPFMANMVLSNAKSLLSMVPEGMLAGLMGPGPEPKDVAKTALESLDLQPGQSLLYLFGDDEWRFDVRVERVNPDADANADYPLQLDGYGPAPEQYAMWDVDEEWDEEEGDEDDLPEEEV